MSRQLRALQIVCVLYAACAATVHVIGSSATGLRGVATIALHFVLTGLMLAAWVLARRAGDSEIRWVVAAGIGAILLVVAVPSYTTHDVQRYVWDGRVLLEGLDPYVTAPNDPTVAHLRDAWPTPVEHARYPTLYPPGALALFSLCALFGPVLAPWIWKGMVAAAYVLLLLVSQQTLGERGLQRYLPFIAMSPLLLLESGVGAHVDTLAALAIATALLWSWRHRPLAAGIALGIGGLIKLTPVLALLPLLVVAPNRRRGALLVGGATMAVVAGYGVALASGLRPWGSTGLFFSGWRFGSPLGLAIAQLPPAVALGVTAIFALAGLAAVVWWTRRFGKELALFGALALPMLLSPVVFPWYLVVLLPVLVLRPTVFGLAWLSVAPLTYEVIDRFDVDGMWSPATWPVVCIGLAWGVGLAVDLWLRRSTN